MDMEQSASDLTVHLTDMTLQDVNTDSPASVIPNAEQENQIGSPCGDDKAGGITLASATIIAAESSLKEDDKDTCRTASSDQREPMVTCSEDLTAAGHQADNSQVEDQDFLQDNSVHYETSERIIRDQTTNIRKRILDQNVSSSEPEFGEQIMMVPTDAEIRVLSKTRKLQGDAIQVTEKKFNVTNCSGAVVAETFQQNIHKEKHVYMQSTSLEAMKEHTKTSIGSQSIDENTHVETRATRKAEEIGRRLGKVMITGKTKQGKTTMALYLARKFSEDSRNSFTPIELLSPDQWVYLLPDQKYVVILDDLLGTNVDSIDYQWSKVLKQILNKVEMGVIILIITCAEDIYTKCTGSRIGSNVFDKLMLVRLSSEEFRLRNFEKVHILEKLLLNLRIKHSKKELREICAESLNHEFFECYDFFIQNRRIQNLHVAFFRHPYQMVLGKVYDLYKRERHQFFTLLKVALRSVEDGQLTDIPLPIAEELAKVELETLVENPCPDFLALTDNQYHFRHTSFHICALLAISIIDLPFFVRVCPTDILMKHTSIRSDANNGKILISTELHQDLSNRLIGNFGRDIHLVLSHDCFSERGFFLSIDSLLMDALRSMDPIVVIRTGIGFGHTALVEMLLEGSRLEAIAPETKHELLHEALHAQNIEVCRLLLAGDAICHLCWMHLCRSGKLRVHFEDLEVLFGSENLAALSDEVIKNSFKELVAHSQTEILQQLIGLMRNRNDFPSIRNFMLQTACQFGQKEVYCQVKETDDAFPCPDYLLSFASEGGCFYIVNDLLKMGANPNVKTHPDYTPLHLACKGNHARVVQKLLEAGADVSSQSSCGDNVLHICSSLPPGSKTDTLKLIFKDYNDMLNTENKNRNGWTPLHAAAAVGNLSSLRFLTDFGAQSLCHDVKGNTPVHSHVVGENLDPNVLKHLRETGADLDARNGNGETPIQVLVQQSTTDRCRVLQYLVSMTKELNTLDKNGQTSLHNLFSYGCNAEETEILIDGGADVNARDNNENTILHLLASSGENDLFCLVLGKGADVLAKDLHGQTPLHIAVCVPKNLKTVKQLLTAQRQMLQDASLNTPFHVACENSVEEADKYIQLLVQHHPMTIETTNEICQTPLHLASGSGGITVENVVEILLRHKANVSAVDMNKNTPLHSACLSSKQYSVQIVQLLLQNDANINATNAIMDTPLHMACRSDGPCKADVINTLVAYGSRLTAKNGSGSSPSDIAVGRGDVDIAKSLTNAIITGACFFRNYKGFEVFDAWNGMLNPVQNGQTILHKICEISGKHSRTLIKELVSYYGNVNAKDFKGKTPLHTACETSGCYSAGIVKELLTHGADINCKDNCGHSALHFACNAKSTEADKVVQVLVENNIRVDERDNEGDTPLHMACRRQGEKLMQALINCGAKIDDCNHRGLTPCDLIMQSTCHARARQVLVSTKLWQICNGNTELKEEGIQYFLKEGASLNHEHVNGDTILHKLCSQQGQYTLKNVKLILSLGADPHAKNDSDLTPYDIAVFSDNLDVAELVAKKQKTTVAKKSKENKLLARAEAGAECCDFINDFYSETEKVMNKAADAVRDDHKGFADALKLSTGIIPVAQQVVRSGKEFFEFFKKASKD